ncbi:hypothetical protein AMJ44_03880 [candidate division WOR-1 bacterium DG_54_3]|uniref:DUF4127 domain-containing protein n=1 Tax=candidate division WOR-1 bacterium DG_54_3 TaxID=1703775 RepID=A0A0S7Y547_UNCSA|nr:MAG: hypothetical protein AMJ44_03880 [candidate division WOR-1 bacterium DG_54_3]
MIKKLALIPLDDRPCNLKFPVKIGKIAGAEIVTPPRQAIGKYLQPGNPQMLAKWLKDIAPQVDAVIVSSDMLSFGGLIASRKPEVSLSDAAKNLEILKSVRKGNPKLKIYLFSTVLRLSITATSKETEKYWSDIFEYSKLVDRIEHEPNPEDEKKLNELKAGIPENLLHDYLKARDRNHEINKLAVEMIAEGIVDFLILGKEDVAAYGLHRKEIRSLEERIAKNRLENKIKILCGADELALILLSRLILESINFRAKIYVQYSNPKAAETIALYEDRTISQTILDHISACGGVGAKVKDEAHLVLFVNTPLKKQTDLFLQGKVVQDKIQIEKLKNEVSRLKQLLDSGKSVALVDAAYANGADPEFVSLLFKYIDLVKLASFAAWNTAGNSIGCSLAEALAHLASPKEYRPRAKKMNLEFLLERFIDDYVYQTLIREKIKKDIEGKVSAFNLGEHYVEIEWVVKEDLAKEAHDIFEKYFKGKEKIHSMKCNISLPWPRIFEADVDVEFE